jgi:hypothetical protein
MAEADCLFLCRKKTFKYRPSRTRRKAVPQSRLDRGKTRPSLNIVREVSSTGEAPLLAGEPAIDHKFRAGRVGHFVGREQQNHVSQFFGPPHPPKRNCLGSGAEHRVVVRRSGVDRCIEHTGVDGIDPDIERTLSTV